MSDDIDDHVWHADECSNGSEVILDCGMEDSVGYDYYGGYSS